MADEQLIKPRELPAVSVVYDNDAIMVDDGVVVGKATPVQIVDAGAPVASEAEAIAGTDNSKRITPLNLKQVLDDSTAPAVTRAQAWAESPDAPDPAIPGSKSSKTWALESEASALRSADSAAIAASLTAESPQSWADFSRFRGYSDGKLVQFNGEQFRVDAAANIGNLPTGPGFVPYGPWSPRHFGFTTVGTITVSPEDDWQSYIENSAPGLALSFADGVYTATRRLRVRGFADVRGASLGGARIVANFECLVGASLRLWNVDLEALDKSDIWLRGTMSYVDFRDVLIDAAAASNTQSLFASLAFSDVRFTASARDLIIDLGPNVTEGWDLDSNTNVKVAGNTGTRRVVLKNRVPAGSGRQFWVFDQGRMIADGIRIENPNGVVGGIGVSGRRGSIFTLQQSSAVSGFNNVITGQLRGLVLRQNSTVILDGVDISGNNRGVQIQTGATVTRVMGTTSMTGNTVNVENLNATSGLDVIGAPTSPTLIQFSTAGSNVAAGSTVYMGTAVVGTEAVARVLAPRSGALRGLMVKASAAPGPGEIFTANLRQGSADRAMSVTISGTDTFGSDESNEQPVTKGDLICIKIVSSAGAAARSFSASLEII